MTGNEKNTDMSLNQAIDISAESGLISLPSCKCSKASIVALIKYKFN